MCDNIVIYSDLIFTFHEEQKAKPNNSNGFNVQPINEKSEYWKQTPSWHMSCVSIGVNEYLFC